MKKLIICLLVPVCFCNCSERKGMIDFVTLQETQFNAKPFEIPNDKISDKILDSLKQAHDSCMGFSFHVNAIFIQNINTFFIGSIVNRTSLKILNTLNDLGLSRTQMISEFNVLTNPCYENRVLHFPLKSLLGDHFILQFTNVSEALNKEINDAIKASDNAEMQTGSWVYLDMKEALKNAMDTTKSAEGLLYRNNLLDTSNMVLTTVESITDVRFIINTEKDISEPLQALLRNKPSVSQSDSLSAIRLSYIDNHKFEMTINGFFPVAGEFMKAELK